MSLQTIVLLKIFDMNIHGLLFACPFSFIILTEWIFPMFTYSSSTSCSTCKNTMVRRMKDSSPKILLDIHVQNSNLFHSLEIILTKENNFLPHVPPPMLYHLPHIYATPHVIHCLNYYGCIVTPSDAPMSFQGNLLHEHCVQ